MSTQKRIQAILDYTKQSRRALGISLGYSDGTVLFHIMNGRNSISTKLANNITTVFPEINYKWLLYGEGEMLLTEKDTDNTLKTEVEFLKKHIKALDGRIELLEQKLRKK